MLQVARLAPNLLGEASGRIAEFLRDQWQPTGGMADRAGNADLYYTVFGLEALQALRAPLPETEVQVYLATFEDGSALDFVHTACLARCWAALPGRAIPSATAAALAERIEACRCSDGGYAASPAAQHGTAYHSFLACGAYQDLGLPMPGAPDLARCLESLRTADGAYANEPDLPIGTTPSTAAALTLLRHLGLPAPPEAAAWLLQRAHTQGGFTATAGIELPDLLSTATALHALSGAHQSFTAIREDCLDFLDSLWTGKAFCGSWADEEEDCEYTYYALLALGHLSL